jgi:FixJ family two-component response regulator
MAHVFLIDDENDFLDTMSDLLKIKYGFNVLCFQSLSDALKKLEATDLIPDLIVSDVFMHTGSGLRLISELEKRNIKVPVFFVSGMIDKLPDIDNLTVLRKPIIEEELESVLRALSILK